MSANVRSGERCNDGESSQSSWSNARAYAREAEAMQACEYRSGMRRVIRDDEAQRAPCRTAFLSNGSFRPKADISSDEQCPMRNEGLVIIRGKIGCHPTSHIDFEPSATRESPRRPITDVIDQDS